MGDGSIIFVGANSPKDFSSYSADVIIIDEHQLCEPAHLAMCDHRISGSDYRYKFIVGNPRTVGSEEHPNLDYEFQNTDQRQWHVPCDCCGRPQVIDWWQHIVKEEKHDKTGGILSVTPRDKEWTDKSPFDMRPICPYGGMPMNRLDRRGLWIPMNPGHPDHGYQLSNIYNVNKPIRDMWAMYRRSLQDPGRLANFINDQLGIAWSHDGVKISPQMLANCATGELCDLPPYRFDHAQGFDWKELGDAA
jgi:hypothetical protein